MAVSDWIPPFPRETLVERIARPSEVRRVIRAADGWYLHGWTDAVRIMPTNAGEWRVVVRAGSKAVPNG